MIGLTYHRVTEEIADTNGVIRIRMSKKNRQPNGQRKIYKRRKIHVELL